MKSRLISLLLVLSFGLKAVATTPIITSTEATDLELISRNNGEPGGLLPVIDRTVTQAGHEGLKKLLVNPITSISTLQARQAIVATFQEEQLRSSLLTSLNTIKMYQGAVQRCLDQEARTQLATVFKKNYYHLAKLQGLNDSAIALDLAHFYEFCSLFGPLIEHLLLHFALDKMTELFQQPAHHHHGHHHRHGHGHHHGHGHDHGHRCVTCMVSPTNPLATTIKVGHFIFHAFNVKEMIEHLMHKADIIDLIHQELIGVFASIKAAASIGDAIAHLPLAQAGIGAEVLSTLCDTHPELVLQSLDECFSPNAHNTLGLFSRVGPTLAAYKKIGEQAELIQHIMNAVGTIDALLGISTLLNEQPNLYSFANYQEGIEPYIELQNFVHPQLATKDPVSNSIILGKNVDNDKIIITGPNKAGKSSITKAIAVNIVLAQTLGIVAARSALLTPLHRLITYINIQDNLANNTSTFLTEIMRADAALQELEAMDGKAPTFALFDDSLFRSTQPAEAERAAYRFIKKLINLSTCATLVVTHFERLTELEKETEGKIHNYCIGLTFDEKGLISSTFQLEPGISPREAIFSIVAEDNYQSDLLQP